ncbi:hypothetical protein KL907_000684 [Ogataea polymorpha]|nr:hypothetical protein KL908_001540 [Ogataea polymorpha]KAG7912482.1 hypothetical protein KL907_000684 [Ogataea polymorpha]
MDNSSLSSLDSDVGRCDSLEHVYRYAQTPSIATQISRTRTAVSAASSVSRSVRQIVEQAHDDNEQTALEHLEHQDSNDKLNIENMGINRAIRIATNRTDKTLEAQVSGPETPEKDKGYAWVVCGTIFTVFLSTWGANGTYGVFLNYWMQHSTFPGAKSTDYALVGSIVLGLAQILAPLAQMTSAIIGIKPAMLIGLVSQTLGYLLASFSTKLWQLYLTQGVLVGIGFAFLYNPSIVTVPDWFNKKRGLSFGIIASASGIGGVVFALVSQAIITKTGGPPWALRAMALITFFLNVLSIILIKERIPSQRLTTVHDIKVRVNILFNKEVLKYLQLYLIVFWFALIVSCYVVALFSLSAYAAFMGLSDAQGSHLTAIFNACQAVGRVAIGFTADYTGRVNLAIVLSVIMVILVLAMWINAITEPSIFAYAVLSGLTFGASSVLNQPILADTLPPELFPAGWSFQGVILGCFTLFCEVVALRLRDATKSKPFIKAQIFCGCFAIGGFVLITVARESSVRNLLAKRLCETEKNLEYEKENEVLARRHATYHELLRKSPLGFLLRLIYPIKV